MKALLSSHVDPVVLRVKQWWLKPGVVQSAIDAAVRFEQEVDAEPVDLTEYTALRDAAVQLELAKIRKNEVHERRVDRFGNVWRRVNDSRWSTEVEDPDSKEYLGTYVWRDFMGYPVTKEPEW